MRYGRVICDPLLFAPISAPRIRSASARPCRVRAGRCVDFADGIRVMWSLSHRADKAALPLADRHYNRQKIGSPQFVPPGRCLVLLCEGALWVTSWPFAAYVRHAWPGAWVNSLFRKECAGQASTFIREAIAATCSIWTPPELGIITFVDPKHVKPTMVHGKPIYGYCYQKAGFKHVGFTKGGLWTWQMLPSEMPAAEQIPILRVA